MKKILILFLTVVCFSVLFLAACSNGEQQGDPGDISGDPSIVLPQDELELYIGQTAKITPKLNNIEGKLFWQTTDPYVASVDQDGVVTARSVGTATISIFNDKTGANITVKVVEPKKTASITFTTDSVNVDYYAEYKLTPVIVDCEGPFTWTSGDESVVKVDNEGNLTPVKIGSADVQINGNGKGAKIRVNVVAGEYLPTVSFEKQEICILKDSSLDFGVAVAYRGNKVSGYTATYELQDASVASVDGNGVITGLNAGKTTMTVDINYRGYAFPTITVPVTIKADVEMRLSAQRVTVYTYNDPARGFYSEQQVTVSVFESGSEITDANVTFETEDETVATVAADGTIKAVAKGDTVVRAIYTDADGLVIIANINVSVEWTVVKIDAVTTIQVGSSDNSITGETYLPLPVEIQGTVTAISGDDGETVKTLVNPGIVLTRELLAAFNRNNERYVEKGVLTLYSDNGIAYEMVVDAVTLIINNIEDFNKMSDYGKTHETGHTGYYVLGADIDGGTLERLSQYCGGSSYETNGFRGILDGRGHTVSNVRLLTNFLFRAVGENAVIKNFAFLDPVVDEGNIPWFIGELHGATVENVFLRLPTVSMVSYVGSASHIKNVILLSTGGEGTKKMNQTLTDNSTVTDCVYIAKDFAATSTYGSGTSEVSGCHAYNTTSDMIVDLKENDYLAEWDGNFAYESAGVDFFGNRLFGVALDIEYSDEVYSNTVTAISADNATFALKETITGVSIDAETGELTVGDVAPDTVISVIVTSTVDTALSKQIDIVVVIRPIDLTANGTYEIELGSAHDIAAINGDVTAIKTATGTKVTLANANVITADEFNSATGVNWSEGMAISFYTANSAYTLNAAFITKVIRTVADLQAVANANQADRDANPGYYIIGNDIDGADQGSVKALSYNSATPDNYMTAGFRGILDGRGHVLKNIKLAEGRFFWGIGNNGTVKNLALIDPIQVGASGYIFARDVVHGTISNVIVKAGTERAILGTACGAVVTNCVFILETNGTDVIAQKDDTFAEHAPSVINNIAVVVKSNSGTINALFGTYYKVSGTYAEYEAANGIHDYASTSAMLAGLSAENYLTDWNSLFTFADGKLYFGGAVVLQ